MLDDGTLAGYIDELSVTGLTSNPTIFDKAIGGGSAYDEQIAELTEQGLEGEELFFELALTDLRRAAELFEPVHERTTIDGRVSLEVSPLLADDAEATIKQAAELYGRAEENFFIKIPGTEAGRKAIEETIFAGIPVNVTLLFSTEHYLGAADAYMRGLERRVEAGLEPRRRLGRLAVHQPLGRRGHRRGARRAAQPARDRGRQAHLRRLPRAARLRPRDAAAQRGREGAAAALGEHRDQGPGRLRRRSTSRGWPSPFTVNTMPEKTLLAFADHGKVGEPLPVDGGDAEETLKAFNDAGIDTDALAAQAPGGGQGVVRRLLARAARDDRQAAPGRRAA